MHTSDQQSNSSINVKRWAECFHALMSRSFKMKMNFADKLDNPTLKAIMMIIALDHHKIAKALEVLFNLEPKDLDPFSPKCESIIGRAAIENIREALSIVEGSINLGRINRKDFERFAKAIERLNDIAKGIMLSFTDVLSYLKDPRASVLRHLALTFEMHKEMVMSSWSYISKTIGVE